MSGGGPARPILLADVGGTNVRFALARPGGDPEYPATLPVADHADLAAAIRAYLARHPASSPRSAAIAVAAAVDGDEVRLTNNPWRFAPARLRADARLESLRVVNDFEAVALALPHLGPDDGVRIGGGVAAERAAKAVLGPGTGLGVALAVPHGDGWTAVPGEGGHVDFAPGDDKEVELLRALWREFGHASAERLLSGPGLVRLWRAAGGGDPAPTPLQVAAAAAAGEPAASAAVATFSGLLGAVAGDLALTAGARGGIYLAGGVVPNLGPAFDRARFRARFEAKGRFAPWLAAIPVFEIVHPFPALLGLARTAAA